jgi:hypothetical protein
LQVAPQSAALDVDAPGAVDAGGGVLPEVAAGGGDPPQPNANVSSPIPKIRICQALVMSKTTLESLLSLRLDSPASSTIALVRGPAR